MSESSSSRPGSREAITDWAAAVDRLLGPEPPAATQLGRVFVTVPMNGGRTATVGCRRGADGQRAFLSIDEVGAERGEVEIPASALGEVVLALRDVHRHIRSGSTTLETRW